LKRAWLGTSGPFCERPEEAQSDLGQLQRANSRLGRRVGGALQTIRHFSTDCGEPVGTRGPLCTSNHPADSECTGTATPGALQEVRDRLRAGGAAILSPNCPPPSPGKSSWLTGIPFFPRTCPRTRG